VTTTVSQKGIMVITPASPGDWLQALAMLGALAGAGFGGAWALRDQGGFTPSWTHTAAAAEPSEPPVTASSPASGRGQLVH
jgi:hypothetical protein